MNRTNWRILKSSQDHDVAMARLIELASGDLLPGTDDFDEFELLGLLIEHYEAHEYPMDKPDPIEAIKFRMDQQGLSQTDMKQYIGSTSKVSEVLNRKRPLSLSMIRRLHNGLGIPADILIQDMSAIEWSPVDAEAGEITVTGTIIAGESIAATPCFSSKAAESYFSTTQLNLSHKKMQTVEKRFDVPVGFSLIRSLSLSLTTENIQNDRMTSDGNYALVS